MSPRIILALGASEKSEPLMLLGRCLQRQNEYLAAGFIGDDQFCVSPVAELDQVGTQRMRSPRVRNISRA